MSKMEKILYKGQLFYAKITKRVQLFDPRTKQFVSGVNRKMIEDEIGYSLPPDQSSPKKTPQKNDENYTQLEKVFVE